MNNAFEDRIAAHLSDTQFEDLPPEAVDAAKKCILDILGVIAAGSSADGIASLRRLLEGRSMRPEATVLITGARLSAHDATWVNGAMARAREMDDSHDATGHHISVPIVPAALAAVELLGKASGREVLLGYVLAADLGARMRLASPHRSGETGFAANTYSPFMAAAVAARLLGLRGEAMRHALGWAYTQCAGGLQLQQSGSSALHIHHGLAAAAGLQAALLARHGLPGPDEFLTGRFGFYAAYDGGNPDLSKFADRLGERFEVTQIAIKLFPCGRVIHGPIEAAIALHRENAIRPEDIEEVEVLYGPRGFKMTCEPESERRLPTSVQHAKFSLYYAVASALVRGHVGLEDFTPETVADPQVRMVASRIRVNQDAALRGIPGGDVTVRLKQGPRIRREVPVLTGTPERPLSYADCAAKFRRCAEFAAVPLAKDKVEAAIDFVANLESAGNVRDLVTLLT
ncbi:MAG: MmgE/PrpD family protein [Betaproteobacteria bacterium]|nr:MmgE/PrpD family protein [Betaproteobacteria bacterium]MBI3936171.1 MmgE/PrpD family protein [Betaproteobacteria bacterium]